MSEIQLVPIELLDDHPDNPRLFLREDVVNGIAAQLEEKGFDPAHALLVRPLNGRYQIVRGHQRKSAAIKANLPEIPCWVRELSDEEAYWELGLSNAQGELMPLEIGRHALKIGDGEAGRGKKGGLSDYARQMGKSKGYIAQIRQAAEVLVKIKSFSQLNDFRGKAQHLFIIHSTPKELWSILAEWVITPKNPNKPKSTPTVRQTSDLVKEVNKFDISILWQTVFLPLMDVVKAYLESGEPKLRDIAELIIEANSLKRDILALQREFKFNVGLFPFTVQGFYGWLRDGKGTYSWDIGELRQYHQQVREAAEKARELPIPDCKQGEWYKLGRHLLYCGDTGQPEFWARLPKAVFAFADPPYNADVADWDKDFKWNHDWLIERAPIVAVTPGIGSIQRFFKEDTEMPYVWSISAWATNGMTRGALGFGNWIYTAVFSKIPIHRNAQDFIKFSISNAEKKESKHKGRKPADFITQLLQLFLEEGELVIDPFLGSGTTLFEADRLGCICIGGEIRPDFCNDIIGEWQGKTGQVAERVEDDSFID